MFSQKQIEELAKKEIELSPKGYDLETMDTSITLVEPSSLEVGLLPDESIDEATSDEVLLCKESLKQAIKRGYIVDENENVLLLNQFTSNGLMASFGNSDEVNEIGTLYTIIIDDIGNSITALLRVY